MRRGKKPSAYRFLKSAITGMLLGVVALAWEKLESIACTMVPRPRDYVCPSFFQTWFAAVIFAVIVGLCLWSAWRWYDDHVRGRYQSDLDHWRGGHAYEECLPPKRVGATFS